MEIDYDQDYNLIKTEEELYYVCKADEFDIATNIFTMMHLFNTAEESVSSDMTKLDLYSDPMGINVGSTSGKTVDFIGYASTVELYEEFRKIYEYDLKEIKDIRYMIIKAFLWKPVDGSTTKVKALLSSSKVIVTPETADNRFKKYKVSCPLAETWKDIEFDVTTKLASEITAPSGSPMQLKSSKKEVE